MNSAHILSELKDPKMEIYRPTICFFTGKGLSPFGHIAVKSYDGRGKSVYLTFGGPGKFEEEQKKYGDVIEFRLPEMRMVSIIAAFTKFMTAMSKGYHLTENNCAAAIWAFFEGTPTKEIISKSINSLEIKDPVSKFIALETKTPKDVADYIALLVKYQFSIERRGLSEPMALLKNAANMLEIDVARSQIRNEANPELKQFQSVLANIIANKKITPQSFFELSKLKDNIANQTLLTLLNECIGNVKTILKIQRKSEPLSPEPNKEISPTSRVTFHARKSSTPLVENVEIKPVRASAAESTETENLKTTFHPRRKS